MTQSVLFVINDARFFVTHRLELATGIAAEGFSVSVAAPPGTGVAEIEAAGLRVHRIPLKAQGLNPFSDLHTLYALWRLYGALRPTIVHQVTIKPILYGTIAGRLRRVPGIVNAIAGLGTVFSGSSPLSVFRRSLVLKLYALILDSRRVRVIFQNPEDRGVLVDAHVIPETQTILIKGSGTNLSRLTPLPEPPGPPLVVLIARLLRQKGIKEFAEAARRLRSEGVIARFALVGDRAKNRDAVDEADLLEWKQDGPVEVWGWRDDMPAVLSEAAVVCLPSYYREGVPKALIDGAAAGKPLVTTDVPGCRDTVEHGVNGLIVPPRDIDALTAALRALLTDASLRAAYGAASRRMAERQFSIESVTRRTADLYRSILSSTEVGSSQIV